MHCVWIALAVVILVLLFWDRDCSHPGKPNLREGYADQVAHGSPAGHVAGPVTDDRLRNAYGWTENDMFPVTNVYNSDREQYYYGNKLERVLNMLDK